MGGRGKYWIIKWVCYIKDFHRQAYAQKTQTHANLLRYSDLMWLQMRSANVWTDVERNQCAVSMRGIKQVLQTHVHNIQVNTQKKQIIGSDTLTLFHAQPK